GDLARQAQLLALPQDVDDRLVTLFITIPSLDRVRQIRVVAYKHVLNLIGVERQGEREHHVRSTLAQEHQVRLAAQGLRSDEGSCAVHARLHFIDKEQVAPPLSARVEVAYYVIRDAANSADRLNQFHLYDRELIPLQERIHPCQGIRDEGIDVVHIGVQ